MSTVQPLSKWFERRGSRAEWVHWKSLRLWLVAIVVLGFALRAGLYVESPRPVDGAGLAAEQGEMARNIVDHGKWFVMNPQAFQLVKDRQMQEHRLVDFSRVDFSRADRQARTQPVIDQMPGVAVVLAGFWWLTGRHTYSLILWLQILLDTVMIVLVWRIAIQITRNNRVGMIAAFLYAIWAGAIVVDRRPMPDTWAVFFTIGCVAAFVWARERPTSWRRLALLGFIAGAGIYFRPFIVLLPAALAVVATPGGGWKRRIVWIFGPTLIALLVLSPWTIRNYYEFHRFIPTRTGLGQAVFEGTGQVATDEHAAQYVRRHHASAVYGSPTYDNFLFRSTLHAIARNPVQYFRLVAHRTRFLVPSLLVLLAWRRWRRTAAIAVAAAAATVVPYLIIGDDTRFYLPAAFAYFILIAMAVEVILGGLRTGAGPRATQHG